MTETIIEKPSPSDYRQIAGVHYRSWQYSCRDLYDKEFLALRNPDFFVGYWEALLAYGSGTILVAKTNGAITGLGMLSVPSIDVSDLPGNVIEFAKLYVDPSRFKQGIGTQLATQLQQQAEKTDADHLVVWYIEGNEPAAKIYERLGWKVDGKVEMHTDGFTLRGLRATKEI